MRNLRNLETQNSCLFCHLYTCFICQRHSIVTRVFSCGAYINTLKRGGGRPEKLLASHISVLAVVDAGVSQRRECFSDTYFLTQTMLSKVSSRAALLARRKPSFLVLRLRSTGVEGKSREEYIDTTTNIVHSPFSDVQLSDLNISEFIWRNSDRRKHFPAMVNFFICVLNFLIFIAL